MISTLQVRKKDPAVAGGAATTIDIVITETLQTTAITPAGNPDPRGEGVVRIVETIGGEAR